VADLLPTTNPEFARRRVEVPSKKRGSSLASTLLVILSIIFTLSAVKQICDLKEQNLSLMQQLAYERQKDAALKFAVRDNIPADRFIQHRFNSAEAGQVEAEGRVEQPSSTWSINLSVLWTSPTITPCDMARLSHVLVQEIYEMQGKQEERMKPWADNKEIERKDTKEKQAEPINLIQSGVNDEDHSFEDSSEESIEDSSEESIEDSSEESIEDDLAFLKASENSVIDSLMNEELDYFLSDAAIWDDSEEYDLFADDSAEQDYYNYY